MTGRGKRLSRGALRAHGDSPTTPKCEQDPSDLEGKCGDCLGLSWGAEQGLAFASVQDSLTVLTFRHSQEHPRQLQGSQLRHVLLTY